MNGASRFSSGDRRRGAVDFDLSFEQNELVAALRRFVETELYPHEDLVERERGVPPDLAREIKQKAIANGFYAMNMPAELGGGGLDNLTQSLAEREAARRAPRSAY
jgi:acyl-CoA dehydrogenase